MSYGAGREAKGASSDAGTETDSDFLMLRTFTLVKPGMMPQFMNALTWQAAWLRRFFKWDRVVAGYALTDVPERVMEIYAVPVSRTEIASAQRVLEKLHEQPEYKNDLARCRKAPQWDEEELIPALGFETRILRFLNERKKERGLVDSKKEADDKLRHTQEELAGSVKQVKLLTSDRDEADRNVRRLSKQIEEEGDPDGRVGRHRDEWKEKLLAKQQELDGEEQNRSRLELERTGAQERLDEARELVRRARDPGERKKKFSVMVDIPAYFLIVSLKVNPQSLKAFEDGMRVLAQQFKWDFVVAGHQLPGRGAGEADRGDGVMNLWTFSDANDLYRQMIVLRESQPFAELDALTVEEKQMLMCEWEALAGTKRAPSLQG